MNLKKEINSTNQTNKQTTSNRCDLPYKNSGKHKSPSLNGLLIRSHNFTNPIINNAKNVFSIEISNKVEINH